MIDEEEEQDEADNAPLKLSEMLGSAFAAAIGVQTSKRRERDFTRGKAIHFIGLGIGATIVFVVMIVVVVRVVLGATG